MQVALMRHQLKTVASAARSGPEKYASMVSNVVDIPKPQEAFMSEIDNNRDTPFVPRIREKPNAVTPLDLTPVRFVDMPWVIVQQCYKRVLRVSRLLLNLLLL